MKDIFQKVSPATGKPSTDMTNIHKEITIDNRIFLKGLRLDTKEEDLENIFKTYGAIVETKIIRDNFDGRSKGFGFITFDSQQVAQDILRDVQSIQTDDMEITIAPAKMKRLPPQGKSFRNRHVPFSHQPMHPQQNFIPVNTPMAPQYYSMPCVVSPDGLFTWYPNIPTYQQKTYPEIIYPDANMDPNLVPMLSPPDSPNSSNISNENKTNNSVESNSNNIYSPTNKYDSNNFQPLQPLPQTPNTNQQLTELTPTIINNQNMVDNQQNEFNKSNTGLPPTTNAGNGVFQNLLPSSTEIVHLNNGYLYPQNAFLPQNTNFVNAYPHPQPLAPLNSTNNKLKPSPIFFNGVPLYDNAPTPPSTPTTPNPPMEINVITSDMKNLVVQPSFQRIHIPAPNSTDLKPEITNARNDNTAPPSFPSPPVKSLGNSLPAYPTPPTKVAPPPQHATEVVNSQQQNGDSMPLKTQNFVFMSTAPGKVNRVVVH